MSNKAQSLACSRIKALLDENSFVEMGAAVSARATCRYGPCDRFQHEQHGHAV